MTRALKRRHCNAHVYRLGARLWGISWYDWTVRRQRHSSLNYRYKYQAAEALRWHRCSSCSAVAAP